MQREKTSLRKKHKHTFMNESKVKSSKFSYGAKHIIVRRQLTVRESLREETLAAPSNDCTAVNGIEHLVVIINY